MSKSAFTAASDELSKQRELPNQAMAIFYGFRMVGYAILACAQGLRDIADAIYRKDVE